MQCCFFASRATRKKRERERNWQLRKNAMQAEAKKQARMKNLAEPAKMKRVLSYCAHWFGKQNLPDDAFIQETLVKHDGWFPVHTLLTFPKMQKWVGHDTVVKSMVAMPKRYETKTCAADGAILFRPVALGRCWLDAKLALRRRADEADEDLSISPQNIMHEAIERFAPNARRSFADDEDEWAGGYLDELAGDYLDHDFPPWLLGQQTRQPSQPPQRKEKPTKPPPKPHFRFDGAVTVARTVAQVEAACKRIRARVAKLATPPAEPPPRAAEERADAASSAASLAAVGFDVEFATLEYDLSSPPAMLTLATDTHATLIWLDKLGSDHGRSVLQQSPSLAALLADAALLKVGVGTKRDARKLLLWWKSSAPKMRGVLELNSLRAAPELPGAELYREKSLAQWCEAVLGRTLPKRKHKGKKGAKESKRAHWRAKELSPEMKQYAAADAAAGLAVWTWLVERAASGEDAAARTAVEVAKPIEVEISGGELMAELVRPAVRAGPLQDSGGLPGEEDGERTLF